MKMGEILDIEQQNRKEIHLFKFGNFWDVYERSAYYFINLLFQYEIHHRKIVSRKFELMFVCFPHSQLKKILKIATSKEYEIYNLTEKHIIIRKVPIVKGFKNWKLSVLETDIKDNTLPNTSIIYNKMYLFKGTYEFSKYILNLVSKFSKAYKFSFGTRLTNAVLDISELSYLYAYNIKEIDTNRLQKQILLLRFHTRLANGLRQISQKQFLYINQNIENLLKYFKDKGLISNN